MSSQQIPPPLPHLQRIRELDIIRGIAILGILLLNIKGFAMNSGAYFFPSLYDHFDSLSDKLAWFFSELFFAQKFYPLLAMPFGAGLVLMARATEAAGQAPGPAHYRRMAGLFVIGFIHAYLLWYGDVLTDYAVCGAIAYPFHRRKPRTLLVLAVICLSIAATLWFAIPEANSEFDIEAYRQAGREEVTVYRGRWIDHFELRALNARENQTGGYIVDFEPLGMMFLGMSLLKSGGLGTPQNRGRLRRLAAIACATGWTVTAIGLIYWWLSGFAMMRSCYIMWAWLFFGGIITSLGYLAFIRLWISRHPLPGERTTLECLGRTALSNYLLQSLVACFIFHGQGLGLIGSFGRLGQLIIVPMIWGIQIILTKAWLKYFPQGPLEMLLRRITRGSPRAIT
ncbi:DUF418 domain-containing protein [Luteolibacter luteus]|uniref:DUF418 domain-containing protein n=1 Tax=Luteolibacter luteus TaxID=2728835 RepID=A0A858RKG8_9BACT|nr:DUF418 domain-containing protein [Luteolibacter luteus]QJE97427.1 DUF418 domain-containing protein [Luteolibacter luteus]